MTAFLISLLPTPRTSQNTLVCTLPQSRNPQKHSALLHTVAERLKEELPALFSSTPDYTIYSPDVTFEDPLNKFRGISRYASNIKFLNDSPVFSSANLTLHDTAIVSNNTVRTRWTLSMVVNLPWSPCVAFTGQSDYVVDLSTGDVVKHYDYWDSLHDSKFFSFPAVADLLAQCRPHIGPRDLGGFHLLRRTQHFQIRRFENPITLRKVDDIAVDVWQPASEGDRLTYCAVFDMPSPPKNQRELYEKSMDFRRLLRSKKYVIVGHNYYYVRPIVRRQVFHEVWLELSQATALVDK